MRKWQLVADSSCDLDSSKVDYGDIGFSTVPLKIQIGEREFVDIPSTDPMEMLAALKKHSGPSSSACPSPEEFAAEFRKAECSFGITMTGQLSGTYNCAVQGRQMVLEEFPDRKIHIVDTLATAGSLVLIAMKLREFIQAGMEFEEIVPRIDEYNKSMRLVFALGSYDMLIKNGRMSPIAGLMASALNIRAVAHNPGGVIKILDKPRGEKRALERIVANMAKFGYKPGTPIVISQCNNPNGTKMLVELMKRELGAADTDITVNKCACLTSYYAGDQGFIVGFEGVIPEGMD